MQETTLVEVSERVFFGLEVVLMLFRTYRKSLLLLLALITLVELQGAEPLRMPHDSASLTIKSVLQHLLDATGELNPASLVAGSENAKMQNSAKILHTTDAIIATSQQAASPLAYTRLSTPFIQQQHTLRKQIEAYALLQPAQVIRESPIQTSARLQRRLQHLNSIVVTLANLVLLEAIQGEHHPLDVTVSNVFTATQHVHTNEKGIEHQPIADKILLTYPISARFGQTHYTASLSQPQECASLIYRSLTQLVQTARPITLQITNMTRLRINGQDDLVHTCSLVLYSEMGTILLLIPIFFGPDAMQKDYVRILQTPRMVIQHTVAVQQEEEEDDFEDIEGLQLTLPMKGIKRSEIPQ